MNCKRKSSLNDSEISADHFAPPIKKQRLQSECDLFNLVVLPELVIKIFSYLPYKDLLLAAALVCKRWDGLSRAPQLWRRINLNSRLDPTNKTVEKLLKQSEGIKYIRLYDCKLIKDSVVSEIAKLKMLQTLILARCKQLSPGIICSVANCRTLKHLDLSSLSLTDDALETIAKSCTNLVKLDVSLCFDITTNGLLPVIHHCIQIKSLHLIGCKKVDDEFLIALAAKSSQIESLSLMRCNFTATGLKYLRKLPKLKTIDVSEVSSMCDNLVSMFSNLTYLGLESLDISNDGISTVVRNNPNLEFVGLSKCKSINDTALEMISKSPCRSTLKTIAFEECQMSEIGINLILQNCTKLLWLFFSKIAEETVNKWRIDYPQIKLNSF